MCLKPLIILFLSICGGRAIHKATPAQRWSFQPQQDVGLDVPESRPLIVAHRGASGMFPEHTSIAYEKAVEQGADIVECDVTITKDLALICSHEPWISEVSNAEENFADRTFTYDMDDGDPDIDWNDKGNVTDIYAIDLTLGEIRTLLRKQANTKRDPNYDWQYGFVTFAEHLAMARERGFAVIPEIKQAYAVNKILAQRGIQDTIENMTLHQLSHYGYDSADDPCLMQTFEFSSLKALSDSGSKLRRVLLANHVDLLSEEWISKYKELGVYGVGINKKFIVVKNPNGHINYTNTELMDRLHSHGLSVFSWTFRNEYEELSSWEDGQDPYLEYQRFLDVGLDGYFTDFPGSLRRFFDAKEDAQVIQRVQSVVNGVGQHDL